MQGLSKQTDIISKHGAEDFKVIFGNIEDLLKIHTEIWTELENVASSWPQELLGPVFFLRSVFLYFHQRWLLEIFCEKHSFVRLILRQQRKVCFVCVWKRQQWDEFNKQFERNQSIQKESQSHIFFRIYFLSSHRSEKLKHMYQTYFRNFPKASFLLEDCRKKSKKLNTFLQVQHSFLTFIDNSKYWYLVIWKKTNFFFLLWMK